MRKDGGKMNRFDRFGRKIVVTGYQPTGKSDHSNPPQSDWHAEEAKRECPDQFVQVDNYVLVRVDTIESAESDGERVAVRTRGGNYYGFPCDWNAFIKALREAGYRITDCSSGRFDSDADSDIEKIRAGKGLSECDTHTTDAHGIFKMKVGWGDKDDG